MVDADQWTQKLYSGEKSLGFNQGYKILYCPLATLNTAKVAFLSLNPGPAPLGAELRVLSDERGNSYQVENETTRSPITEQFLRMTKILRRTPLEILTGVAAPFRSAAWDSLSNAQREGSLRFGREFWGEVLLRTDLHLIIASSQQAAAMVCYITGAKLEAAVPSGWGTIELKRFRTRDGRRIIQLPQLSRYKLFSRSACIAPLKLLFEHDLGGPV